MNPAVIKRRFGSMHEFPVTLEIIRLAEECTREKRGKRIVRLELVVGELTGFIGDSIRMYFEAISKGTLAEGAELQIMYMHARLECVNCGELYDYHSFRLLCPFCGSRGKFTAEGRELYIKEIEIEV